MASAQCHKPSDQTNHHQNQSSTYHHKSTTTEISHNNNTNHSEHSFSNKVKEMAHSACKLFNHHENQGSVPNHGQKPASNCSSVTGHGGVKAEKKKMKRSEGYCMPKMREHMKNMQTKNNKMIKNKEDKHRDSSSDSSSDSDNEKKPKKKVI